MGALTDRQFQSYRRVRPGAKEVDDDGIAKHSQYAVAVTGVAGGSLVGDLPDLITLLILEQRRTNRLLELAFGTEVGLEDVD